MFEDQKDPDELSEYSSNGQKALFVGTFGLGYVMIVSISTMQAPIFPPLGESKGLSPQEYGIVFGIYFITMFVATLTLGKRVSRIGVKVNYVMRWLFYSRLRRRRVVC